jgi:acetoin utilization deacetylase AcuC-like enzyme
MPTLLLTHPDCLLHDMGEGHPERPDRLRAVDKALSAPAFAALKREQAPLADVAAIERLHPPRYVEAIRAASPRQGLVWLDPDTAMCPKSFDAALRASGATIYAMDQVMSGAANNAFCAVRPPGHHAEPSRPMGFCLFNNVAIAALHARTAHGAERVAVVDFDVHHGNGTQDAFWSDKNLFYGSTHQMPLFPGTGALSETGAGNIFNAPLNPLDGSARFREAFLSRILPALTNFAPDVLLISAGFDAHRDDPLATCALTEETYAAMAGAMRALAGELGVPLGVVLEGGYDLEALARSTAATMEAVKGDGVPPEAAPSGPAEHARAHLARWWPVLR